MQADAIIEQLNLKPHPEGGWYCETYRASVTCSYGSEQRSVCTNIYFLLKRGESSAWHRVDAVETWHWYLGAPLVLEEEDAEGRIERTVLGPGIAEGQQLHAVIDKGVWQRAKSLGDFTLVGCSVAPAFCFEGFEMR